MCQANSSRTFFSLFSFFFLFIYLRNKHIIHKHIITKNAQIVTIFMSKSRIITKSHIISRFQKVQLVKFFIIK